jgi:hypothetical protein
MQRPLRRGQLGRKYTMSKRNRLKRAAARRILSDWPPSNRPARDWMMEYINQGQAPPLIVAQIAHVEMQRHMQIRAQALAVLERQEGDGTSNSVGDTLAARASISARKRTGRAIKKRRMSG